MDPLSLVLDRLRLSAKVYFRETFGHPWGMAMHQPPFAQFHLVVRGDCWLTSEGSSPRRLVSGDAVLIREGVSHELRSAPASPVKDGLTILNRIRMGTHPSPGETRRATDLICGHFEWRQPSEHPLLEAIPPVIQVSHVDQDSGWLQSVTATLIHEMTAQDPGSETVSNRLAECLYIRVLRDYLKRESTPLGALAALKDPSLRRALAEMHAELARGWTVASLAETASMSRASFARHFKSAVGKTPMEYLSRCRMHEAQMLLAETARPLQQIALDVGFSSPAAFSTAFKKRFGRRPGAWRGPPEQKKGATSKSR